MQRLLDKVVIVTGGATGIGEAISKKFAFEGAKVLVAGHADDPVQDVVEDIINFGGDAVGFAKDISLDDNARACISVAINKWGKLNILINNAGVFPEIAPMPDYKIEAFDYMIRNNIRSTFLMTEFALEELKKNRGVVLSAGSEAGKLGLAQNAPYGGTKGFIHAFMKGVAAEQAKNGIRANCICPGPVDTAWTHKETSQIDQQMEQMMVNATPMGRRGSPEEIANAYLFLASDEASYITGELLFVDGGITISKGPLGQQVPDELKKQPKSAMELKHQFEGATSI
ncbi:MAG: SDR family NAD(P)-dependent oxidoreductase [Candidatus Cyclobacteriaceae bacterium M3_2C_046]